MHIDNPQYGNDDLLMHAPEENFPLMPAMTREPTRVKTTMVDGELIPEAIREESQQEGNDEEERRKDRRRLWMCSILLVVFVILGLLLGVVTLRRESDGSTLVTPQPTSAPETPAPSQSLAFRIQSYSPWTSFDDADSGQNLALEWITTDEYYLSIESELLFMQRFALVVLYFATGGPLLWPLNFLADGGECTYPLCDEEACN